MKIIEYIPYRKRATPLSAKMFPKDELTILCSQIDKGAYTQPPYSEIFDCIENEGYRIARLEVWPRKVVLVSFDDPTTALTIKRYTESQFAKTVLSVIDRLTAEGVRCFWVTFMLNPKQYPNTTDSKWDEFEYRLMNALEAKVKEALIPIIYKIDNLLSVFKKATINHYCAVRFEDDEMSLICSYDNEEVDSICKCSHHIIEDYRERFFKAPKCLQLVSLYKEGLNLIEQVHHYYGLPMIDETLNLHGVCYDGVLWVYGFISSIKIFCKKHNMNVSCYFAE